MKTAQEVLNQPHYRNQIESDHGITVSGIKDAMEEYFNQDRWIRVEDGLPENRKTVLCYTRMYGQITLEYKHGVFFDGLDQIRDVKYWQPLPTPPELL